MHVCSNSKINKPLFLRCLIAGLIIISSLDGCRKQKKSSDSIAAGQPLLASEDVPVAFGAVGPGSSTDVTITLENIGDMVATNIRASGLTYPFRFKDSAFPGTGGTCPTTLPPGVPCTLVLTYAPTLSGIHRGTFTLVYTSVANDTEITTAIGEMGGNATNGAALNISDSSTYDFGTVVIGNTSDKTFTMSNDGTLGASAIAVGTPDIAAPYTHKGGTFPGTGGNCGATLNVGSSCTFVVVFTPVATGAFNDTIRIAYNDGLQAQSSTRAITGTGQSVAFLGISGGPTYDFGNQYQSLTTDVSFTITNSGGATATSLTTGTPNIAAPYTYKGGSYPGTGGSCGSSLAGSDTTCTIVVRFTPTAVGAASDTIRLSYNNGVAGGQSATRAITGTGVGYATLSISNGATYDFGSKAINTTNTDKSFTVTNANAGTASVVSGAALSAPFAYKGGSYPGTGGTCAASVGASGTCTIVVTYSPTTLSAHSGTLTVNYTRPDASTTTATRAMSGTGVGNPGELDTTWGTSGRTATTFGSSNERAYAIALQSDGKAVVAGYSYNGTNNDFAIARYTTSGALDTGFGTSGKTTIDVSSGGNDIAYAVVIQSDGKILVGGQAGTSGNFDFAVARLSSAGALDATYGAGGTVTTNFNGQDDYARALALDSNGKLVAAGPSTSLTGNSRFALVRYGTDGSLDTSFDSDGKATYQPVSGADNVAYAVTIQSNGKIVVAGSAFSGSNQFAVARVSAAGALDTGFDSDGYQLINVTAGSDIAKAVKVDSSDKIVLGGISATGSNAMAVVRLSSAGALDTTFDTDGIATVDVGSGADDGRALAIDSSGNIIVAGLATNSDNDFGIARFSSSGALDATFGTSGLVNTDYDQGAPADGNSIYAIAIQSDGKIVAVGDYDTGTNADFALFRYWP